MAHYEIVSRSRTATGWDDESPDGVLTGPWGQWDTSAIGSTGNEFATYDAAQEGIEELRKLGYEWNREDVEYFVREVAD